MCQFLLLTLCKIMMEMKGLLLSSVFNEGTRGLLCVSF